MANKQPIQISSPRWGATAATSSRRSRRSSTMQPTIAIVANENHWNA